MPGWYRHWNETICVLCEQPIYKKYGTKRKYDNEELYLCGICSKDIKGERLTSILSEDELEEKIKIIKEYEMERKI